MKIKFETKEPLVNATYKIPPALKDEIDKVASKEKTTQGELVRALLTFAFEAYHAGNVHRLWGERMMEHFRKQAKVGDVIIAGGIVGTIKGKDGAFFNLEIAPGTQMKIVQNEMTDILNPSKELLAEMERYKGLLAKDKGKILLPKKKRKQR